MQTIILLANEEDSDAALENFPHKDACLFIALSPSAAYSLRKRSIRFKTPLDYPRGEERFTIGLDNFARIKRTTALLDSLLAPDHTAIPTLKPAQYPVYFLKNLFDTLSTTTHLLKTIIREEKPTTIVAYKSQYDTDNAVPFPFKAEANIFALVLQLPGWGTEVEIKARRVNTPKISSRNTSPRQNRRYCIDTIILNAKKNSLIFNMGLIGKRFGLFAALSSVSHSYLRKGRFPVMIYESGYNWDDALPELYRHGFFPIVRLTDAEIEQKLLPEHSESLFNKILGLCKENVEFRKNAEWCGIDTSPILLPHLAKIVEYSLERSPVAYKTARDTIRKKNIRSILISIHTAANTFAVVQAAHDSGIPVFSWQHGGGGYNYHPIMPYAEFAGTDYHLVYGPGVAESYRDTTEKMGLFYAGKFVPAGSSSFDRVNEGKKIPAAAGPNQILYVTTNYYLNFYYISFPAIPLEYDLRLWSVQQKIMDCAKEHPGVNMAIKLHPGHEDRKPLEDYKNDNGISNIRMVVSESSVPEMVETAGMVIIDLVSTSILQILRYNKPLFVYTGNCRIDTAPLGLLKKRAYVYDREEDFIDAITRFIRNDRFPFTDDERQVDVDNTEFLESYGTYLNDGRSAERAASFVRNVLKNEG